MSIGSRMAPWLLTLSLVAQASPAAAGRGSTLPIDFHGFVQTSWLGSATNKQNDFRINEVQLEVGKDWVNKVRFMLRLNYRWVDNFDAAGTQLNLDYDKFIEQAWVSIDLLKKSYGLTFTVGKFAIPMGYGSINITERRTYSPSYTTDVGTPNFGTGILVQFRKWMFDFSLYAINGWNTLTDNNDAKSFGGRLGFSLFGGELTFGVSYLAGPEPIPNRSYVNVRSPRHVLDIDLVYTGVRNLFLAAEFNYGWEDRASQFSPDARARWLSAVGEVSYRFLSWLGGLVRFEHADDPDASRLYMQEPHHLGTPTQAAIFGVPQTVEALTLAALFRIGDNLRAVLEFRNDWIAREEDSPTFPAADGTLTKTRRVVAASIYYVW